MAVEFHVGDTGTLIQRQVLDQDGKAVNLSTATTKQIILKTLDGAVTVTKTADFTTDGKDGWLQCYTSATDLSAAGRWFLEVRVAIPGGEWRSTIETLDVVGNLA